MGGVTGQNDCFQILQPISFQQRRYDRAQRLQLAPEFARVLGELFDAAVLVTGLTRVHNTESRIHLHAWDRDGVIGARVAYLLADCRLLQERHVARNAAAAGRVDGVPRVLLELAQLRWVTVRALRIRETVR